MCLTKFSWEVKGRSQPVHLQRNLSPGESRGLLGAWSSGRKVLLSASVICGAGRVSLLEWSYKNIIIVWILGLWKR